MSTYVEQNLNPSEKLVYLSRPHWVIFMPACWWFVAFCVFTFWQGFPLAEMSWMMGFSIREAMCILSVGMSLIKLIQSYLAYISSEYAITSRRVLVKVGFIRRSSFEVLLKRVESIRVYQSVPGRVLNYGTIIISGTGGTRDAFYEIPDPLTFRKKVQASVTAITRQA